MRTPAAQADVAPVHEGVQLALVLGRELLPHRPHADRVQVVRGLRARLGGAGDAAEGEQLA